MAEYRILNDNIIIRVSSNTQFPKDKDNPDYQRYLAWLADGNTPDPVLLPPVTQQQDLPVRGTATTVGASPSVILYRITVPQHTLLDFSVRIHAIDRAETQVKKVVADATFARGSGAPVQIGNTAQLVLQQTAGASTWTNPPSIQGNDIVVTVTGSAGLTIDWSIQGICYRFGPQGL